MNNPPPEGAKFKCIDAEEVEYRRYLRYQKRRINLSRGLLRTSARLFVAEKKAAEQRRRQAKTDPFRYCEFRG